VERRIKMIEVIGLIVFVLLSWYIWYRLANHYLDYRASQEEKENNE